MESNRSNHSTIMDPLSMFDIALILRAVKSASTRGQPTREKPLHCRLLFSCFTVSRFTQQAAGASSCVLPVTITIITI
jgi:hypothetical protein